MTLDERVSLADSIIAYISEVVDELLITEAIDRQIALLKELQGYRGQLEELRK